MLISKFSNTNVDVEAELLKLENEYKIKFPEQYKRFLIKYNGGQTPDTKFKIGKESSDVRAFYGIGNVKYSFSDRKDLEDWLKDDFLPIACDSFGNVIAISLNKKTEGKIYFCDHEKDYKTTALAENLKDFVKLCKSKKMVPVKTIEEREKYLIAHGREHIINDRLRKMWQEEIDEYGCIKQEPIIID